MTRYLESNSIPPFWMSNDADRVFIIAEIGVNHNGQRHLALQLIDAAAASGADAVKFQTFRTESLVTETAEQAVYQTRNLGSSTSQADMLRSLELSKDDYAAVILRCKERGIQFLSTPFDRGSADFLETMGVHGFKVSSGDLTFHPFLAYLAVKGRPIILSSGMADLGDIEDAISAIYSVADVPLAVLHCVSNYPCEPEECNLRAIDTIAKAFPGVTAGWSDHSLGAAIGVAAAARDNCRIIEKHFTLARSLAGPDHKASLEPEELRSFIADVRKVSVALGTGRKQPTPSELETAKVARRVLVAVNDMPAGTVITETSFTMKRAGAGLMPSMLAHLIGARVASDLPAGTIIALSNLRFD